MISRSLRFVARSDSSTDDVGARTAPSGDAAAAYMTQLWSKRWVATAAFRRTTVYRPITYDERARVEK
uniref:Uncharacterized protein n=1 Tax=Hyaloperonospora arabidopsidis (strain Emoy2) TaxID=559515 RepID=M4BN58_HYAAE